MNYAVSADGFRAILENIPLSSAITQLDLYRGGGGCVLNVFFNAGIAAETLLLIFIAIGAMITSRHSSEVPCRARRGGTTCIFMTMVLASACHDLREAVTGIIGALPNSTVVASVCSPTCWSHI